MPSGSRPGERRGGRKKGSLNKRTIQLQKMVEATGLTPLELMLNVMRSKPPEKMSASEQIAWRAMQLDAAKAAAPYVHPRMGAKDGDSDTTLNAAKLREDAKEMRERSRGPAK